MPKGFSFVQHKCFSILGGFLALIITVGLPGCTSISRSLTYEVNVPIVICTPDSPLVNVYRAAPQPWANRIFESAFPPFPTPIPPNPPIQFDEQQILRARYAAFEQLMYETERWSDTETIKLKDLSETSITLTYISPELLQAVFLNQVLYDRSITYGFQDQLQKVLNTVAARDELLFLLTVTTNTNPTSHTIKIPVESMFMHNAENLQIAPSHDDHNLEMVINTASDPVFGYLAYPLGEVSENQCKWVLDPKYNTNIVIAISSVVVDDADNKTSYSWIIPYAPLINPVISANVAIPALPPGYDPNLYPMTPLTLPPGGMHQGDNNNWHDFARFVWGQITLAKY